MRKVTKGLMAALCVVVMVLIALPAMAEATSTGSNILLAKRGSSRTHKKSLKETVRETIREELGSPAGLGYGSWEYMATRMRPPKSDKWKVKWNDLGNQKWELVGRSENIYIFKRPAVFGAVSSVATPAAETTTTPAVAPVETPAEPKVTPTKPRKRGKTW